MERAQESAICEDLEKKMVFLTGPRKTGKTTLAKALTNNFSSSIYLNYDSSKDRQIIQNEEWSPSTELIILDEVHKMPKWRNYLKKLYDKKATDQKILAIGSALDAFKGKDDLLANCYFLHRLMPLSPKECDLINTLYTLDQFLTRGGFPEPFLSKTDTANRRWHQHYIDSLFREDILDFDNIHSVKAMRLIFELLRERVGSPISFHSIAKELSISPTTVKKYIEILEALYIVFRVIPYSKNIPRSLLKEPKLYFFDTSLVKGSSKIIFENFIAVCLLKDVFAKTDYSGTSFSLNYLQTKEKKEVDFAIVQEGEIEQIIEVKFSDSSIHKDLLYFHQKYNYTAIQIVKELKKEYKSHGIEIWDALHFLKTLSL